MWRFAWTQMRTSVGKLVLAGIAIVLGTGFITGTLLAGAVMRSSLESMITASLVGADVVAEYANPTPAQLDEIKQIPGVRAVDVQLHEVSPVTANTKSYYLTVQSLPVIGEPPTIIKGKLPSGDHELAIAQDIAKSLKVDVGDEIRWQPYFEEGESVQLTVTGITKPGIALLQNSPGWMTPEATRALQDLLPQEYRSADNTLLVYLDDSRSADEVATAIGHVLPDNLVTTSSQRIDAFVNSMTGNTDFFLLFSLAFAAVAIVVAGMVIQNTFSVLVAQRARTLALLRCSGATRWQVRSTVMIEATLLGLIASACGVLAGLGLGYLGTLWVSQQSFGIVSPGLGQVGWETIIAPIVVGTVVTFVAALGPASAATKVSPVAALRPVEGVTVKRGGWVRLVIGLILIGLGLLGLLLPVLENYRVRTTGDLSDYGNSLLSMLLSGVAGGSALLIGYLLLSIYIVPPMVRLLGAVASLCLPRSARATARLAAANAARNPRRTAATTSALVIGVSLVTLLSTGAATGRATINAQLDDFYPIDATVQSYDGAALTPQLLQAVEEVPGVLGVARIWQLDSEHGQVAVADLKELREYTSFPKIDLKPGHVGVSQEWWVEDLPSKATLRSPTDPSAASLVLPAQTLPELPQPLLVARETVESKFDLGQPSTLYLDIDDGQASKVLEELKEAVAAHGGDTPASVSSLLEQRLQANQAIDAVVAVIIALVGVAVAIALVGIANTLSLSVIERRREHGMLRSVGVTRPQLRSMLSFEGVLISVTGVLYGIILGMVTGFAGSTIIFGAMQSFVFGVDWLVLLGSLVVGIAAGLLASVAPARTALKVPVVVALADD